MVAMRDILLLDCAELVAAAGKYCDLKSNNEKLQYFTCQLVVSLSEVADYM
jgi:hypothetical protein